MAKFRILHGFHAQTEPITHADGTVGKQQVIYKPLDIVESKVNLVDKFNSPGSNKFEQIHEERPVIQSGPVPVSKPTVVGGGAPTPGLTTPAPTVPTPLSHTDSLETMTVTELTAFAAEEEIDLKGAKDKAAIIRVLRAKK